jgi:GNAT superfamily N-acetyltransferase
MCYTVRLESKPFQINKKVIDVAAAMDKEEFAGCEVQRWTESYIWIVRKEGRPVGYACMRYLPADRMGYFSRVAIKKEHRRRGLHRRTIYARMQYAKRLGWKGVLTYVSPSNIASANSLFKLGFQLYIPNYKWAGNEFLYLIRDFHAK